MTRGENNPRAVLSDDEVDMLRDLYEDDLDKPRAERFWTAPRLAEKFEITLRHVRYLTGYSRRSGETVTRSPEEKGHTAAEARAAKLERIALVRKLAKSGKNRTEAAERAGYKQLSSLRRALTSEGYRGWPPQKQ